MQGNYQEAFENQAETKHPPLFVVGHARSGTGLTVRALSLAQETCFLGESRLFSRTYFSEAPLLFGLHTALQFKLFERPSPFLHGLKVKMQCVGQQSVDMHRFVRHMFRYCKLGKTYDLSPSNPVADVMGIELTDEEEKWILRFTQKYRMLIRKDPDLWVRILLQDCCLLSGRDVALEKTPLHVFCLPLIWRIFPEAKVIATVRDDIQEVLASYYLMTKTERYLPYMLKVYRMTKSAVGRVPPEQASRFTMVRYEDWLEDPQQIGEHIFSFTGLEMPQTVKEKIAQIKKTSSKYERIDQNVRDTIDRLLRP